MLLLWTYYIEKYPDKISGKNSKNWGFYSFLNMTVKFFPFSLAHPVCLGNSYLVAIVTQLSTEFLKTQWSCIQIPSNAVIYFAILIFPIWFFMSKDEGLGVSSLVREQTCISGLG
jgi:amino acid permease